LKTCATCGSKTMKSESESLFPGKGRDCPAVQSNCVAAMRGGEQLRTEVQPQSETMLNSIRRVVLASLRTKGEAWSESFDVNLTEGLSKLAFTNTMCAWSGDERKVSWSNERYRRGGLSHVGVRGFIVVKKPRNCGGAKEPRKVNTR
jgi:hypothetical protein